MATWIISHFPAHRVYIEPYGGGAGVLLKKPRSYAEVYNDLDSEIVNVMEIARDKGEELKRYIELTPYSREAFFKAYEPTEDKVVAAANTIIKSMMGFGSDSIKNKSGFRNDSNRSRTTPAHDWMHYPDALKEITERLRGVIIEKMDALKLIEKFDKEDSLFYIDPPYVHSTRQSNKRYRYEMSDDDHEKLAQTLRLVKGKVIISGYESELYNRLYSGWRKETRKALADGARSRIEVLWFNF